MSLPVNSKLSDDPMNLAAAQGSANAESGEWHQNCLAVTLLLAAAFDKKGLKKMLKRAGCSEQAQEARGEVLLHALHEACHANQEARAAVSKELNARFGATVRKSLSCSAEEIMAQAEDTPWPIPLLWACYSGGEPERQEAGRRLSHLIIAKGMKRLQGDTLVEREKQRADKFCEQNQALRQALDELKAENRDLSRRLKSAQALAAEPAPPPETAPSAHKKRAKELGKELEQARRDMEELRQEVAVWRALACREEERDAAEGGMGAEPNQQDCPEPCPDCGRMCGGQCPAQGDCPLRGRQIAVIGGLDRLEKNYTEVIEQLGGSCMCHTGKVRSGARRLRQMVSKSDLVVFLTPINSHAALNVVKKQCKLCSKPFCPINCTSPAALESHLKQISQEQRLSA